uniref:Nucleotide-diphospho-sugar transferase domain-containing protein n=1 Tax=viral metagenome TaxID=1070528 RepID=A0A6C0KPG7_9ZZZZ
MSEDCKTVVVTLTDKDYYPRAKRTIIDIRTRGQWAGDIVLVTIGFHASQNFLDFYQVTEKQFEPISTTYLLEQYRKYPLQTVSDNRHLNKVAQWNKFHLFDEWFTQWRRIIFMDAGLRVFDSIHYLLELPFQGKLYAPDDLPKYNTQEGFGRIMELPANPPATEKLFQEYSKDIVQKRYFLNCIWVYDSSLLSQFSKKDLIDAMNEYPICRCNEMTTMNLLFTFKHNVWEPFPEFTSNGKRLFGWTEHDRDYGPFTTWRDFCFIKYPSTIHLDCE